MVVISGRCATCRHWGPDALYDDGPRTCSRADDANGYGPPSAPTAPRDAFAMFSESESPLYTGPDFGCIHHEPAAA